MTGECSLPLLVFSYAHEDGDMLRELRNHLKSLEHQRLIKSWVDRDIDPGMDFRSEINVEFNRADIVLLLISSAFIASDFCYRTEMTIALERKEKEGTVVIPVILRPCAWKKLPFGKLIAVPEDGTPIVKYYNRDDAYLEVVEAVEKVALKIADKAKVNSDDYDSGVLPDELKDSDACEGSEPNRFQPNNIVEVDEISGRDSIGIIAEERLQQEGDGVTMTSSQLLNFGRQLAASRLAIEGKNFPSHGLFEVAAKFEACVPSSDRGSQFIQTIQDATPYAGDNHSWSFFDEVGEKYYQTEKFSDGFETHCYSEDAQGAVDCIRFNRFSTNGEFYHLRTLADDDNESHGTKNRKPYTGFDVDLPVIDTVVSAAIAIRYGRAMNLDQERGRIALSCRWSGLKGRVANAWIRDSDRWLFESSKEICEDVFEMSVVIPSNTPDEKILSLLFPELEGLYKLMLASPVKIESFTETVKRYVLDRL